MVEVTQAVARALAAGAVYYRLLLEDAPLWAQQLPLLESGGLPLYVLCGGAGSQREHGQERLVELIYSAPCCDGDIGLGHVCSASLTGTLQGAAELLGATIQAELGTTADGEMVWLPLGRFVVDECSRSDDDTRFVAHDLLYAATGSSYQPTVGSGAAVSEVLADVAAQCGLGAEQSTLNLGLNLRVTAPLTGHSCREMLGYLAMLCGRNCVLSREGKLRFVWFAQSGAQVDAGDYYDGGLSNGGVSRLSGLTCTVSPAGEQARESVLTVGNPNSALHLDNPLMTQDILEGIWLERGDWEYPVGEVELFGGALVEPGDVVELSNRAGVCIQFPVMQTQLRLDGGCRCTLSAWGKAQVCRENAPGSPVQQQMGRLREDAHRALLSANGKNKVFHRPSAPAASEGLSEGDLWFDTSRDCRINTWTGSAWSPFELGEDAIANLSITNAKIADGTIQSAKIAGLDAGKITTGTLSAQRIGANSITADKINVSDLFAQTITATGSITGAELTVGEQNNTIPGQGYFHVSPYGVLSAENASLKNLRLDKVVWERGTEAVDNYHLEVRDSDLCLMYEAHNPALILAPLITVDFQNGIGGAYYSLRGNVEVSGSISEGGTALSDKYSRQLLTAAVTANVALTHDTYNEGTLDVSRTGYTPLGIVGFSITGSRSNYMNLYYSNLNAATCYYGIRNMHATDDVTDTLTFWVLYVSN